jgi:hypothetical protein
MDWRRFLQAGPPATTMPRPPWADGGRIFYVGSKVVAIDSPLDGGEQNGFQHGALTKVRIAGPDLSNRYLPRNLLIRTVCPYLSAEQY